MRNVRQQKESGGGLWWDRSQITALMLNLNNILWSYSIRRAKKLVLNKWHWVIFSSCFIFWAIVDRVLYVVSGIMRCISCLYFTLFEAEGFKTLVRFLR